MTIKTNVISSFHEPFFIAELDLDNKKILKYLDKTDFIPTAQSEIGTSNSLISKKLNILNDIPNLKKQISFCLKAFIEHELAYDFKFKLLNSWATKTFKNGFSHKHYHSHSFISGVYYPMGNPGFNIEFTKKYINKFWNMPVKDIIDAKKVWVKTKQIVNNGDIVNHINKNIRHTNFPNKEFNRVSHVRPHALNSKDTVPLPVTDKVTKAKEYTNLKKEKPTWVQCD
jgi:hypothetical protein